MYCTAERLINATWATLPIFLQDYFLTMNWELPIGPSAIALGRSSTVKNIQPKELLCSGKKS